MGGGVEEIGAETGEDAVVLGGDGPDTGEGFRHGLCVGPVDIGATWDFEEAAAAGGFDNHQNTVLEIGLKAEEVVGFLPEGRLGEGGVKFRNFAPRFFDLCWLSGGIWGRLARHFAPCGWCVFCAR